MRRSILRLSLLLASLGTATTASAILRSDGPVESTAAAKRAIAAASGQALQGDMRSAMATLRSFPRREFGPEERRIRECMLERFGAGADGSFPAEAGPFAGRLVGIFRAYWRAALLEPRNRAAEEERLQANLARLTGIPKEDSSRISNEIEARLAAEGYRSLMGRTPPLLELMIWRDEQTEVRNVPLPEGEHEVTVKLLDDFASLGWSAYATCDRSFTGGWVGSDAIHAVRPGWKSLEAENYRISFLAHETQHFADKERFPGIGSADLEFRAKLAELALAEATIPRLLSAFAANQGDDPDVPHTHANKRVLTELRKELGLPAGADLIGVPVVRINEAAKSLLIRDTLQREER